MRIIFFVTIIVIYIFLISACQKHKALVISEKESVNIILSKKASFREELAAKELRRYIYHRTGRLPDLLKSNIIPSSKADAIVIGCKENQNIQAFTVQKPALKKAINSLSDQEYYLKTVPDANRKILLIVGGDSVGTLYGAYKYCEHLGIRFYLHGDVIPDRKIKFKLQNLDERGSPLFSLRGIHPFHDFPEGPDWWNSDDYKAILAQLPKMGMNFFALHTYPEGGAGPEPTVWIGSKEDIAADGKVKNSYPSRHMTTKTDQWNYRPKVTSDYSFGASEIFERDDFGADYMIGVNPWKEAPEEVQNKLFNDFGENLNDVFTFAKNLGIKTCIGTELPLTIPIALKKRLEDQGKDPDDPEIALDIYEGIFTRIKKTHPLDFYWLWTHEGWTWQGVDDDEINRTEKDLLQAIEAAKNVNAPFTLATCGWVLGPASDRGRFDRNLPKEMPMSCINRNVGFQFIEKQFSEIAARPKWAIPWMEDDPAMIIPQLWVGRMRRDAADALTFGCNGLMGIHWRTRILGPNVSALAKAGWNQGWNPDLGKPLDVEKFKPSEYYIGGAQATYELPIEGTEDDPLYQSIRYGLNSYHIEVPSGDYKVTLKFSEPHYEEKGKRVFGVKLKGRQVLEHLDIFNRVGKNTAIDFTFENIKVIGDFMEIEFSREVEYPSINAIVIEGLTSDSKPYARRINCAGSAYKDYEADLQSIEYDPRSRDLRCDDFYADWAKSQFGDEVAKPVAEIFTKLDGTHSTIEPDKNTNMPRPSTWNWGPGGLLPDKRLWKEVKKEYYFVEEMANLRPLVEGAGNLERFDYWLDNFYYLRSVGKIGCTLYRMNKAIEKLDEIEDLKRKKIFAQDTALPIRKELISNLKEIYRYLLSSISTPGGMGNVANFEQHIPPRFFADSETKLLEILGEKVMQEIKPDDYYDGPARIIVPTVRTLLEEGEQFKLKVIILGADPIDSGIYYRTLGKGRFSKITLDHINRGVYSATLPREKTADDFEYYIEIVTDENQILKFPSTTPDINQSVVVHSI